jgi:hypothetical protein
MPVDFSIIPAVRMLKQEDFKFEVILTLSKK